VSGQISSMKKQFKEKICDCLGCCDTSPEENCFFPVAYNSVAAAAKSKASA